MSDNGEPKLNGQSIMGTLVCDPALGGRRRSAKAGTILHQPGANAEDVFWIQHGEIRLYQLAADGSRRLLDILGPGDWFGAESLAQRSQYGCLAQTITDATVWVVPAQNIVQALPRYPRASLEMIRQLAGRLNVATEDAGRLAFDDCRKRLVSALVRFSRSAAATATADGVELRMTHAQLAQAVGAARETVSLTLTQLRNANLLRTGRNLLTFDPKALGESVVNFE